MARIFLSYAREDIAAAQALAGTLDRAGHDVWWDHHLRAGSRFSWDIGEALKAAEAVVVLWSKDSIESVWVQDEAAEGLEGGRLIPAALDSSKPPLGFRQYHTVDVSSWRAGPAAYDQLLGAIDAKASRTSASSSPPRRETMTARPLICVRSFANKSGDSDQDYFSDGITDDVITDLSKISALTVIARNTTADLWQLATEFGVTHVLEGTVRKSASRLRITAQLVEAPNGRNLWAERYERELSDIFEIQDEISHAIVDALQLKLLPHEKAAIAEGRTTNVEAYDLYLKARGLWPAGAAGDWRKNEEILRLCTQATAIDPGYANAWALLALAAAELRFWQGEPVDAISPAERAIALDPQMAEAHCVRARHLEERGRVDEARAAIAIAVSLDEDSWEANREAGQLAFRRGQIQEAMVHLKKAVALAWTDHGSASMLISACRFADAAGVRRAAEATVAAAEHFLICDPANGSAFASAAHAFAALGECDRAKKWIRKSLGVDPGNLAMRYNLAATASDILNDESQALEILEPFAEAVRFPPHLWLLELDPRWASIRDGVPFQAMLARARKRVEALAGTSVSC